MSPLFVKYRTKSGNCYVYDRSTEEIIRVGETVFAIIDDFSVLNTEEVVEKHKSRADVREALAQLTQLQSRGILCDHVPRQSCQAYQVLHHSQKKAFADFVRDQRSLLVLELTQRCNLRCKYCCLGEHYSDHKRNETPMSVETATNVVRDFLNHQPKESDIAFYGGEPLLEFELLKQIVRFAEEYGTGQPNFSVTTNGTLLTDEVIHFFVQHKFRVMVSMDGTKESHDRYRVFPNGEGSYDVVMARMRRFVELYPDYKERGISLTFTATADLKETDGSLRNLVPFFPGLTGGHVLSTPQETNLEVGDCSPCDGTCTRQYPDFCHWTKEREDSYQFACNTFIRTLCEGADAEYIEHNFPYSLYFFRNGHSEIHNRLVLRHPPKTFFSYYCVPGAGRIFCSASGTLVPCQKTETGDLFRLGDAKTGIDVDRALRLTEWARLLGDCANCVARRLCSLCLLHMKERGNTGQPDALAFQRKCRDRIGRSLKELAEYTTVMEENQELVDTLLPSRDELNSIFGDLVFVPTEEQLSASDTGVEELESCPSK